VSVHRSDFFVLFNQNLGQEKKVSSNCRTLQKTKEKNARKGKKNQENGEMKDEERTEER
jgi:hypothetical protein